MHINTIGEIGINFNGDMDILKKLIDEAVDAGFDFVKFQKRNPDISTPESEKNKRKSTPWGEMSYLEYKYKMELSREQYVEIDAYCKEKGIKWFASVWDMDSAIFMKDFSTMVKIPSAKITDLPLLEYCRKNFKTVMISVGMSTQEEIDRAIAFGDPDIILHCNSSYPCEPKDLNLNYIKTLQYDNPTRQIGYSSHSFGIIPIFASVALGAEWIEAHITLSHDMWGSDQASSVEPMGMRKIIKGIRDLEVAMGDGIKVVTEGELSKRLSLRGC